MKHYDLIIIGAGASGMMSACLLASSGLNILILEKNNRVGKKLSATGNGRCNLTNTDMRWTKYYADKDRINAILDAVTPQTVIDEFMELGVYTREKDGYVYPHTNQAMTVVNALARGAISDNIEIHLDECVNEIIFTDDIGSDDVIDVSGGTDFESPRYEVRTQKDTYGSELLILACGGSAGAEQGGSDLGYELAKGLGHTVTEIYPGLTGLNAAGGWWKSVAGTRVQGSFSLFTDDILEGTHTGEIQITKTGVSGIPVFQLCRVAAAALSEGKSVWGEIDFVPKMGADELLVWIEKNGIEGIVPDKWISVIDRAGQSADALVKSIKHFSFTITDTYPIERAQISAGGVAGDEVDEKSFLSRLKKGMYILGELNDIDGLCGGYNLHIAWASAYLAANDILSKYS